MSIGIGQHGTKASAATTDASASPTTTGSTLVVCVGWYTFSNVSLDSVTDNKGNTYTRLQSTVNAGADANMRGGVFICQNATGGSGHTFTANWSATPDAMGIDWLEVTGAASASLDQGPAGKSDTHDSTTPYTSNTTGTTTQAAELVVAALQSYTTTSDTESFTWGNSFTKLDEQTDPNAWTSTTGYRIVSSTGTFQSSVTCSGGTPTDGISFIMTFKEAAGGGGATVPKFRALLGVGA
jgi:hypothetical protein